MDTNLDLNIHVTLNLLKEKLWKNFETIFN